MDRLNGGRRQVDAGVELRDGRVVPRADGAGVDAGQGRAIQLELAGRDAREVRDSDEATDAARELYETELAKVGGRERSVRAAEGHSAGLDGGDAGARAGRLVVDLGSMKVPGPALVERRREGGAAAGHARD